MSYPKSKGFYTTAASLAAGGYHLADTAQRFLKARSKLNNEIRTYRKKRYKGGTKKRRYYKYKNKKAYAAARKVRNDIKVLKKRVNSGLATYTKKYRTYATSISSAVDQVDYHEVGLNSISILEGVIDAVKYFDAATNAIVNVDLSANTFQNKVRFTRSYGKILVRNNYSVPCRVGIYFCVVKKDTSIVPVTAMSNSLTDMSNGTTASPLIYPSDCEDFNDLWKIEKHKSAVLQAGEECELSHGFKPFDYDISLSDSHNNAYQGYFKGCVMVVRTEGILSHGSTSGVTLGRGGVDVSVTRIHSIEYNGNSDIKYLEIDYNAGTIVGTAQVSQLDNEQATYAL